MDLDPRLLSTDFLDERERIFFDKCVQHWHADHRRKFSDLPYVTHLLAVARKVKAYTVHPPIVIAALGHDLLEDTSCTENDIRKTMSEIGFQPNESDETVRLIKELTDEFVKAKYPQLNRRKRKQKESVRLSKISPAAQTIKYADLIDNALDLLVHDRDFARIFVGEMYEVLKRMNRGDFDLYMESIMICSRAKEELSEKSTGSLVAAYLRALGDSDTESLLQLFSDDAVVFSPRYGRMPAADFYRDLFAETQSSNLRLYEYYQSADGNISAFFHYDWLLKSGQRIRFDVCDLFSLNEAGEIRELRIIYDTASVETS